MTNRRWVVALGWWVATAAGCGNLADGADKAYYVRYTPSGSLVVFAGDVIDVYGGDLAVKQASVPVPQLSATGAPQPSYGNVFALSDDGTTAAASVIALSSTSDADQIELFSLPSGDRLPTVDLGTLSTDVGTVEDMVLSPTGDLLYVLGPINDVYRQSGMFDTNSTALLWSRDWTVTPVFSPDGASVFATGNQGQDLFGFDARSGTVSLDVTTGFNVDTMPNVSVPDLIGMADAHTLIGLKGGTIEFVSADDGSLIRDLFQLADNEVLYGTTRLGMPALRCAVPADLCAVGLLTVDPKTMNVNDDPQVKVWRISDGTLVQTVFLQAVANDVAISPDGQLLATADELDAQVFRISDGSLVGGRHYSDSIF